MKLIKEDHPLKKPVKKATKKTAKKANRKPAKKTAQKLRQKSPKKSAAKPASKARKAAKKVAAKKPAKKSVKRKAARPKAAVRKPAPRKASPKRLAIAQKPSYPPLVAAVLHQLSESKAEQVVTIDLVNRSTVADTMVIASGRSNRHVNAIADQIVEALEKLGQKNLRVEGKPQCDWVLVDSGDIIVHIFRPEVRSFYNLEKLWSANAPQEKASSA